MAWLRVQTGTLIGKSCELVARETIIGRHPSCDIVLPESTISRRHARIRREGEQFFIDDLGSQHGTFINGQRITGPKRLTTGDRIQLSQGELSFLLTLPTEPSADADDPRDHSSTIVTWQDVLSGPGSTTDPNSPPKLKALLDIIHNVGVSLDQQQIFPKILDSVFRIFPQADRAYILLANPKSNPGGDPRLDVEAMKLRHENNRLSNPVSRTVALRVMAEGTAFLSSDASQDVRFISSESVHGLKLRSVMCAPLIGTARKPMGMIQVDTQNPSRQFTADDLDVLVSIANLTAQSVDHARLHDTQVQFHRRERDMEIARQVQLHFLPAEPPIVPNYRMRHYYSAADGVGGDYFGYTNLPDGRCAITMGDVAGKGVPAALLMGRLCSDVRYALVTHPQAPSAVEFLNQQFARQVGYNCFITFTLCLLDPIRHELVVVNAGHMPPLLRRASTGVVESLATEVSGPPLGIDAALQYRQVTVPIGPGDLVCLYTDGVNEASNADGDLFGIDRIQSLVQSSDDADSTVRGILEAIEQFTELKRQDDDICIVCFSRDP